MIYFTSDTHFYNKKRLPRIGQRSFYDTAEKNTFMIQQWNRTVTSEDEVYILGDFSDGTAKQTEYLLKQLNGKKYLVIGNNDRYLDDKDFNRELFEWTKHYYELHTLNTKFVLFHFPIEAWSGYSNDRVHLHGHIHRPLAMYEPIRRYEVGVDSHDGRPVSINTVWEAVKKYHNTDRQMDGEQVDSRGFIGQGRD